MAGNKKAVLAGFHAVTARLRLNPESIDEVYVDRSRHDRRMHEMCEKLKAAGIRPVGADAERLDRIAGHGVQHQGIVAVGSVLEKTLSFDELLDSITDKTLLLILDGVTDPRNFGACLRVADAAGVQAVIAPLNRSSHVTPAAAKAAAGAEERNAVFPGIADRGKRAFRVTIRAAGNDPDGIVLRQRLAGGDRRGGEPVIFHRLLQHGGGIVYRQGNGLMGNNIGVIIADEGEA